MLKIWGRISSINVQKVVWAAQELRVPFERQDAGGKFGGLDTPEYVRMNPNKLVPVIDDDGFILWESNAIVRYLASRHGAGELWPGDLRTRADADRWMDWQATEFAPGMRDAFMQLIRTPQDQRDDDLIAASVARSNRHALLLEDWLYNRDYLTGKAFTVADIAVGAQAHRWLGLPIERPETPRLQAWYQRISQRESAQGVLTLPLA
ncbi:glutathione S-transferase family protein [Orrella sp. JC864]|uniref:glutathione S-transferase family protein n=1 Tax=Orrella sp. JC864 TaxID=3120298 RepID=UPI00300BC622